MDLEEFATMDSLQEMHWWYRGRRVAVRGLVAKYSCGDGSILDLGCGAGEGSRIVEASSQLVGLDISDEALAHAGDKGYASLCKGSAECLPFKDQQFDTILMLDVLEHISDDGAALRECNRVLMDHGVLLLTVPAYPWLWSPHDEVFGHCRRYTASALQRALKHAGFRVEFRSHFVMTLLPIIALFRMVERKVRNAKRSHFFSLPRIANAALFGILCCEAKLLAWGCKLPAGSTIVVVATKIPPALMNMRGQAS